MLSQYWVLQTLVTRFWLPLGSQQWFSSDIFCSWVRRDVGLVVDWEFASLRRAHAAADPKPRKKIWSEKCAENQANQRVKITKKWQNPKNISLRAKATYNDGALVVANGYFLVNEDEDSSLFFLRPSLRNILRVCGWRPLSAVGNQKKLKSDIFFLSK